MKLKEWFIHESIDEVIGDPGDQGDRGKGPNPAPKPHPQREMLGDEGDQSARGKRKPPKPSLPANEDLQLESDPGGLVEYEDPTSSKHGDSTADSKWASPMSSREGMPHEDPHSPAQQHGADGWEEMRKSSDSHYPASHSSGELKGFFGDDPYPKSSSGGSPKSSQGSSHGSSHHSSQKVSEGPTLPKKMPTDWLDQPMSTGPSSKPGAPVSKGSTRPTAPKASASPPVGPTKSSSSEPVPWRALQRAQQQADEPGGEEGKPDYSQALPGPTKSSIGGSEALKKSGGGFSMGDPSGQPRDDTDVQKFLHPHSQMSGIPKIHQAPKELSQYYDFPQSRQTRQLSPILKPEHDPDDEYAQTMRSDPLGAETAEPEQMTWDELKAAEPAAAQDLEREVPEEQRQGATFERKQDGRVYMDSPSGRQAYLGPDIGWTEMDDGSSPAGEF